MADPYTKAVSAIDAAHALDPTKTTINGKEIPYELHYAQKCTEYLSKRRSEASETLKLAIRAQHFRRWEGVFITPSHTAPIREEKDKLLMYDTQCRGRAIR
jgi:hypothetical protein